MRLRGWHIEGFGLLHDFNIDELPDGLTVVLGPNEAGKSSLLAFIRGALFGYPDRRRRDRQYPPLRGGRHGGRLFVESDQSTAIVERFASPSRFSMTHQDGSLGTEAELHRMLGGVDAELHRNVFAFSLSELQEFTSLQVEGVRDRIFAAGVVGAGRSARSAIDRIISQREEIGRKRGECRINGLRDRTRELEELLNIAKARATRHPELRRAVDEIDEEQRRVGLELSSARRELAHLDALLAAWPDWDEQVQAKIALATLDDSPDLSEDFGMRLESALNNVQKYGERRRERDESVRNLDLQLEAPFPNDRLAAEAKEVKRLAGQVGSMRARRERIPKLDAQCLELQKRLSEEAPRLGPGWTISSVRGFDASIPAAQVIGEWGERLTRAELAVRDAEENYKTQTTGANELESEVFHRAEALKRETPQFDLETLTERDSAVRKLRSKIAQLAIDRAELRAATQRLHEISLQAVQADADAERAETELSKRRSALDSAAVLPGSEEIPRNKRAIRELRNGLADLAAARADLRSANQRAIDAMERTSEAEIAYTIAAAEVERHEKALSEKPSVPDEGSIVARERVARELRSKLVDLEMLQTSLRAAEIRLADLRSQAERHGPSSAMQIIKRWLLAAMGVLGVVALVLFLVSQLIAAAVVFAVAIVGLIFAVLMPNISAATPSDSSNQNAEAARSAAELKSRISTLENSAKLLAARLELSDLPDRTDLEEEIDKISSQYRSRQERDRASAVLEQFRRDSEQAKAHVENLSRLAKNLQTEVDNIASQRVNALELASLTTAKLLAFNEIPTVAELEEKATDFGEILDKIQARGVDETAVQNLEIEADRARAIALHLAKEHAELQSRIESAQAPRVRAGETSALQTSVLLGHEHIPEPVELEETAKQVDDQFRGLRDWDRDATALEELRRRAARAAEAVIESTAALELCRRSRDRLLVEWSAWKKSTGCPEALRPETAQQFFASVERLRASIDQLDALETERETVSIALNDFAENCVEVAERAGFPRGSESVLAEDLIESLQERSESDSNLRVERNRLTGELERARNALASCELDGNVAAAALDAILAEAGVSNERECRVRIEDSRKRADLKKKSQEAEQRLRSRLGIGAQADKVRSELKSGERQEWDARKSECKATLAKSQPVYEDAVRRHQTAIGNLSALERECDVVTLATEREAVIAEMNEALSEWRLLAVAQSLVQATLRRYEEERQPAVLVRAADNFSHITQGRYSRLVTREDGIDLIAADGSRLDAAALSRGTAEQLYLCLRLALAAEFGRLAVPLPFVMDDVLVNFDSERARLAAEVLVAAAPDHQILLFTCHPETVELFVGLEPSTRVIEIQRQSPTVRV